MNSLTTVIVSDTHIGHDRGLKSDTAMHKEKTDSLNKIQEAMFEKWKELAKKYRNPDCLILNGDIPELLTITKKESECWTTDATEIKDEANKLLKMFGKPKKIFAIKGTPAHVEADHLRLEEEIARDLGAEVYHFKHVWPYRLIDLAPAGSKKPALYHVTHHISATSGWYRGTAPAKAMVNLMLNESHYIDRRIWNKIVGLIRSHVHHFWYEESVSRRMIINPCWQGATNWMIQKMPETPPDIGSVILVHHKDGEFEIKKELVPVEEIRPPVFKARYV